MGDDVGRKPEMDEVQGDAGLAAQVRSLLGARHPVVAAAAVSRGAVSRGAVSRGAVSGGAVSGGEARVAGIGAALDADFELGSISKGITGLLYADACGRGELGPDTTLGELLPLGDCPAAGVSLASASRHSSGLPGLPRPASPYRRTAAFLLRGTNPYGETLDELMAQARTVRLSAARPRYSNFGFELLGHATAAAAGMSYRNLVRERLSDPLGLGSVYMPATAEELGPRAVIGRSRTGRVRQPWTGEALAPAGGIRASIGDIGRLVQALLDGSAPGMSALDPVADFAGPAARIGAAWITLRVQGRDITWHNGATGGFRTWVGLDREAGTGVVILSARAVPVDRHGFRLLEQLSAGRP